MQYIYNTTTNSIYFIVFLKVLFQLTLFYPVCHLVNIQRSYSYIFIQWNFKKKKLWTFCDEMSNFVLLTCCDKNSYHHFLFLVLYYWANQKCHSFNGAHVGNDFKVVTLPIVLKTKFTKLKVDFGKLMFEITLLCALNSNV